MNDEDHEVSWVLGQEGHGISAQGSRLEAQRHHSILGACALASARPGSMHDGGGFTRIVISIASQ